jgi:hypothetical protein
LKGSFLVDALIAPNQLSTRDWLGDIVTFADIRKLSIDGCMDYYHLNTEQRTSVRWLSDNHLSYLSRLYVGVDESSYRSVINFSRVGFDKWTQFILLSLVCVKFEGLRATVVDNRLVQLGKNGGKQLLNPARRGNDIHGERVLIAPCLYSKLIQKTFTE